MKSISRRRAASTNANVSLYNQTIASFPWLVVARIHGMEKAEFYEIDDKKREFKVNFD